MVSSRNFSLSGRLPSLRADITERLEHFGAFERAAGGTAVEIACVKSAVRITVPARKD